MVPATAKPNSTSKRDVRFRARAWASKKSMRRVGVAGAGVPHLLFREKGLRSRSSLLHLPGEPRGAALLAPVHFQIDRIPAEALASHPADIGNDLDGVALH